VRGLTKLRRDLGSHWGSPSCCLEATGRGALPVPHGWASGQLAFGSAAGARRRATRRARARAASSAAWHVAVHVFWIQRIWLRPVQLSLEMQSALRGTLGHMRGRFDANPCVLPWLRAGRWFSVRAGNPAVLGAHARRPEALRPHLSVSLPLKSPATMHSS